MTEDKMLDRIVNELEEKISGSVRSAVNEAVRDSLKPLHKKLDSIQVVADHSLSEANEIGRDISDTRVVQSETAASLRELLSGIHKQSKNIVQKVTTTVETQMEGIADKVEESVQPVVEDTLNKFVETNGKKMTVKKPRHFFRLPFFQRN